MAVPSGARLTNPDELLFRQVNPAFIHKGRVSSQAFIPTKKDEGLLSTSRESLTTPETAYNLYVEELGLASAGVWGVTVGECEDQQLTSYADPVAGSVDDPAHCVVDFRNDSRRQARKKGSVLARVAQARDVLHAP